MLRPNHKVFAHAIFSRYTHNFCRRRFHSIELLGAVPELPMGVSVLLLPNHSSWWDGFFIYLLNERVFQSKHKHDAKREFNVMMLETKLREFWFFQYIGAFSINQQSPKAIAETLSFTASLLDSAALPVLSISSAKLPSTPLVAMFPQGELRPWHTRPLGYNRGVEWLLKKCQKPVAILPLAMRCEFLREEKPEVFLQCGDVILTNPHDPQRKLPTASELEQTAHTLLDDLESRIVAGERGVSLLR